MQAAANAETRKQAEEECNIALEEMQKVIPNPKHLVASDAKSPIIDSFLCNRKMGADTYTNKPQTLNREPHDF